MTVGAIVLAAGSARRMGSAKLMADLGGMPLLSHSLLAIASAGLPLPIVTIAPDSPLAGLAGSVRLVEVGQADLGMGHSIAAAVAAVPDDWHSILICLGDMPFVSPVTLQSIARRTTADNIVRPEFEGRPGNPLAWGRAFFPALAVLHRDSGARSHIDMDKLVSFECGDEGILFDVDTPEALDVARVRYKSRST